MSKILTTQGRPHKESDQTPEPSHTHAYIWPAILKRLPSCPAKILDIGCGNGAFSTAMAIRGHRVVGIDVSSTGIEIAKSRTSEAEFHRRDLYDDLPDEWIGGFDVVVSLEVLEHLYFPGILVQQARRALKPRGRLILSTPYHGYLKNLAIALAGKMDDHHSPLWDHGHIKFFSKEKLTELLVAGKFQDLSWDFCGRFPYVWKSMIVSAISGQ